MIACRLAARRDFAVDAVGSVASMLSATIPTESLRIPRLAVLGAFLSLGAAAGSWGSRIPDVRIDLELGDGSLGTALLGLSLGAVSGAWIGGLLVKRLGSRRTVRGAWIAIGVTMVLPGLASSWASLAAALLVFGLAFGLLDVSMNGAGVQLEHAAGRPLLNGLHAGWSAGVLFGALSGTIAVGLDVAPRWHLIGVGAVIVLSAVAAAASVPDGRAAATHDDGGLDGVRSASAARRLAALAAICSCVFLAEGAVLDWAGVYVRENLGGRPILGALAVTGASAGGLIGRLLGDRLTIQFGPPRLVAASAGVALGAFAAVLLLTTPIPAPALLVVVGAGLAPAVPLAFAAAGRRHGEHGIAVATTAGYGAYLAGPAAIGWIADASSLRIGLLVPLVLVATVIPLAWSTS